MLFTVHENFAVGAVFQLLHTTKGDPKKGSRPSPPTSLQLVPRSVH